MKKYIVAIEEIVVDNFEVEANSADEAWDIATEKYRKGEFVLHPEEVQFKQMSILKPHSEATEWTEF